MPPGTGFSLLELLVALVIMTAVFIIAIPSLTAGGGTELKAAARTVAAGMRKTRNRAVTRNEPAVLTMDVENRRFQMAGETRTHTLPRSVDVKLFTAQAELISDEVGAIRFFPDGSSTGGRITVSAADVQYHIDVDWLTGRIRLLDDAGERISAAAR